MKTITTLLMMMFLVGCQSTSPEARVFAKDGWTYQGAGLYIYADALTATNLPNDFAIALLVNNGYSTPVFVNAEEALIFQDTNVKVVCYDRNGKVLATGELREGQSSSSGSRCHPERYVRIGEGCSVYQGKVGYGCCTMTDFTYRHPLDFETFTHDDGIFRIEPKEMLSRTLKMDVTVPVHIEYFVAGDERLYSCDTNVTVTIAWGRESSQPSDVPPTTNSFAIAPSLEAAGDR